MHFDIGVEEEGKEMKGDFPPWMECGRVRPAMAVSLRVKLNIHLFFNLAFIYVAHFYDVNKISLLLLVHMFISLSFSLFC